MDRASVRRAIAKRTGLSRGAAAPEAANALGAGTQSGTAPAKVSGVGALFPEGCVRTLNEQPRRTRIARDEAAHEDLGKFPVLVGSTRLRHAAQRAVHHEAEGPESHQGLDARAGGPEGEYAILVEAHRTGNPLTRSTDLLAVPQATHFGESVPTLQARSPG